MAIFNFTHGLARRQEDGFGGAANLQPSNGGAYVDIIVSPDPTVFIISHYDTDYMVSENSSVSKAWGPFVSNVDYWLYWDIDFMTGQLTRGFTTLEPTSDPNPPSSPQVDQHWFDTDSQVLKVWSGSTWIDKLRCFSAKYQNGATLVHFPIGSQVGISGTKTYAGTILFDPSGSPLQKFSRNRRGQFITTETDLHSQFSRISNFRVEAAVVQGEAHENIPIHHAVSYYDFDKLILARNTDPSKPAIGIAAEDMNTGEVRSYITKGFITNEIDWDWSGYPAGTALFLDATGAITPTPPTNVSMQKIGRVVNRTTIFVDIGDVISFDGIGNLVPMQMDKGTGALVASNSNSSGACAPRPTNALCTWGWVHEETTPSQTWVISHNMGSIHTITQVYDISGEEILPDKILVHDINTITLEFTSPQAGTANLIILLQ